MAAIAWKGKPSEWSSGPTIKLSLLFIVCSLVRLFVCLLMHIIWLHSRRLNASVENTCAHGQWALEWGPVEPLTAFKSLPLRYWPMAIQTTITATITTTTTNAYSMHIRALRGKGAQINTPTADESVKGYPTNRPTKGWCCDSDSKSLGLNPGGGRSSATSDCVVGVSIL